MLNITQLSVNVYSLRHQSGITSQFDSVSASLASGMNLDMGIVTELTQENTLPPYVKYSLNITMFSLNSIY